MFLLQPEVGWEDKQNWCYQVDVVCFIMPSENENNNNNNSDNINLIVPLVVMSYLLSTILAAQGVIGFSRIRNSEIFYSYF